VLSVRSTAKLGRRELCQDPSHLIRLNIYRSPLFDPVSTESSSPCSPAQPLRDTASNLPYTCFRPRVGKFPARTNYKSLKV
jgi:hypothetical protein